MAEAGYPIQLHLRDKQVAVVGGGAVGARKTRQLLRAGARVLLICPQACAELRELAARGQIQWRAARYQRDMLKDTMPILVIAAADEARVNQTVAQDAQRIRALCNVADGSGNSDFSNMALLERPPLTIALSSDGASPALLRLLKERLAAEIGEEYALLAGWLGELRATEKQRQRPQAQRQALAERILQSPVLALLQAGEKDEARRLFQALAREGGA